MKTQEFEEQLEVANSRGMEAKVGEVHAVAVRYDHASNDLVLSLRGGLTLLVPVSLLQGVAGAAPELIESVELQSNGAALHWEELDADFSVQSIAAGSFGSNSWMQHLEESGALDAASIERRRVVESLRGLSVVESGRKGGSAQTEVKVRASRANGAKGGRPRKLPLAA